LTTVSGLAARDPQAVLSRCSPWLNCISQMKRSMLGAYWTIWSQQKPPSAVLSKTVVGSSDLNVLPASVE
jgi:hypothetical protein